MDNRLNKNTHIEGNGVSDIHIKTIKEVTGERTISGDYLLWDYDEKAKPAARRGRKADRVPFGDGRAAIKSIELRRPYQTLLMEGCKMKKLLVLMMAAIFVVAFAAVSIAGIVGSSHDFSGETWTRDAGSNTICEPCHLPHNPAGGVPAATAPLWNHTVSTGAWTPYVGHEMDATVGDPDGVSVLCLGCHDGTVAEDSFGGRTGTDFMSGSTLLGTDLTNDHPISFVFDSALATADGELFDPTTNPAVADRLDSNGKVQCTSCHSPHNSANQPKLLVMSNSSSALCLTCHDK